MTAEPEDPSELSQDEKRRVLLNDQRDASTFDQFAQGEVDTPRGRFTVWAGSELERRVQRRPPALWA